MYLQFDIETKEVLNISDKKMPAIDGLQMIEFNTDLTVRTQTFDDDGFVLEEFHKMPIDVNDLKTMLLEDKGIKFSHSIETVPYDGKNYYFSLRDMIFDSGLYTQAKFAVLENDTAWEITQITTDGTVFVRNAVDYVAFSESISLYLRNLMGLHYQDKGVIMAETTEAGLYDKALGI